MSREGMLFSSSLLFPGLLMSKLRGCYNGQGGRRQGRAAWGGHRRSRDRFTLPGSAMSWW